MSTFAEETEETLGFIPRYYWYDWLGPSARIEVGGDGGWVKLLSFYKQQVYYRQSRQDWMSRAECILSFNVL